MGEGQGEVRETGTGNATPPCLLRGDITGIDAERGDREKQRERFVQLSFWMITDVLGVVVQQRLWGEGSCLKASAWICLVID